MASSELYRPVKTVPVRSTSHAEIQGVPTARQRLPHLDGYLPDCSIVVSGEEPAESEAYTLRQITPIHRRSYEVVIPEAEKAVWYDEYGNLFSSITVKGNNLEYPKILKHALSPSGYLFYG